MENDMSNQAIADAIRDMKTDLFVTLDSIEAVVDRSADVLSVMIAVNTTLELVAKIVEGTAETSYDIREQIAHEDGGDA